MSDRICRAILFIVLGLGACLNSLASFVERELWQDKGTPRIP